MKLARYCGSSPFAERFLKLAKIEKLFVYGEHGAKVGATSRHGQGEKLVRASGAGHFFLDDGAIAAAVRRVWEGGADKVLELVGATTLADSLAAVREPGIVCMAGMVGDSWSFANFAPMDVIPTGVLLTTYSGGVDDFLAMPLQALLDQVADGVLPVRIGRVFGLDDIVKAHRTMEANAAGGKIVVITHPQSRTT